MRLIQPTSRLIQPSEPVPPRPPHALKARVDDRSFSPGCDVHLNALIASKHERVVIVPHPVKLMQLKRLMQPSKADTAKEADTAIQAHTAGLHPFTVVSTRVDV